VCLADANRLLVPVCALLFAAAWVAPSVWAQAPGKTVQLAGVSGNKALVVIDNQPPKFLALGDTHGGVRLLQVTPGGAKVVFNGQPVTLLLGESPVSVSASAPDSGADNQRAVLTADSRGHFLAAGSINGRATHFMVDTGATPVVIGLSEAKRLGLKPEAGQPIGIQTANGNVQGRQLTLQRVRLGQTEVTEVAAVVVPQDMPHVLLGNSFLNRFQMRRDNDQMTLMRRY
jgi:aspartyl protease family protein